MSVRFKKSANGVTTQGASKLATHVLEYCSMQLEYGARQASSARRDPGRNDDARAMRVSWLEEELQGMERSGPISRAHFARLCVCTPAVRALACVACAVTQ